MSVGLSFGGIFDTVLQTGTFDSTGHIGTSTWEGSGAWIFTEIDPFTSLVDWKSKATIAGLAGPKWKPDGHSRTVNDTRIEDGFLVTRATRDIAITLDGAVVFRDQGDSLIKTSLTPPKMGTIVHGGGLVMLTGIHALDEASGIVTTVPEPSTWLMFGTGLLGLLGYGWRRKKRAA